MALCLKRVREGLPRFVRLERFLWVPGVEIYKGVDILVCLEGGYLPNGHQMFIIPSCLKTKQKQNVEQIPDRFRGPLRNSEEEKTGGFTDLAAYWLCQAGGGPH